MLRDIANKFLLATIEAGNLYKHIANSKGEDNFIAEVSMDEVVRHLGTNRNAIYKILHDARRKLKIGLQARGFDVAELLTLFSITR